MKTFRLFVEENNKKIPAVLISQGKHSIPRDSKEEVPNVLISQGKHSIEKSNKSIKEDYTPKKGDPKFLTPEFSDEANAHIAPTIHGVNYELHRRQPFEKLSTTGPTKHKINPGRSKRTEETTGAGEQGAIKKYTFDSGPLNKHLFSIHKSGKPLSPRHAPLVRDMDSAMSRNKLHKPLTVFSGTHFDPNEEASKNSSRHVHLPAYTSTSLDAPTARVFAVTHLPYTGRNVRSGEKGVKHVLRIHLPEGHHGFYIGQHSSSGQEHEFIMPRNTRLRIAEHPEVHHSEGEYEPNIHVWDTHPVAHEDNK